MTLDLYVANDSRIRLTGLRNTATGVYLDDATVQADLTELPDDDAVFSGQMVADGSGGDYTLAMPSTAELVAGRQYRLAVTATLSGGVDPSLRIEKILTAQTRGCC